MRAGFLLSLIVVTTLSVGCAAPRQSNVGLDKKQVLSNKAVKVGVAMTPIPQADTRFPGADCLLCIAAASAMNSSLTSHTQKLPPEGLAELKSTLAQLIRKHGADAVLLNDEIKLDALPDYGTKGTNIALKDFTGLKQKYSIDKILVLDVQRIGMYRNYSAYFPTSDPRAELAVNGFMVNLSNNTYEWYRSVEESKGAQGTWDEPPTFPGLTNAYFQTLETGKDKLVSEFN